jgi:hypothetical protein
LNLGFNKIFNFDGNFQGVPFASNTGAATVWSFGLTAFGQRRFREPTSSSYALFVIPSLFLRYLRAMERQPCRRSHRPLVRLKFGGIVSPGLGCNTHRDGRICDSGFVVWRSGNRGAFRPARVGLPDIFGESDVKLFGLQLSPMDSRCRDQDGLALLTDAGCLLGDCAQRLCLRTTKRYPASFGGRQGSHSAL